MKARLALLGVLLLCGASAASAEDAWTAQYAEQAGPLFDTVLERTPGTTVDQHQNVRPAACCKICRKGKACGDSCIKRSYTCTKPPECA